MVGFSEFVSAVFSPLTGCDEPARGTVGIYTNEYAPGVIYDMKSVKSAKTLKAMVFPGTTSIVLDYYVSNAVTSILLGSLSIMDGLPIINRKDGNLISVSVRASHVGQVANLAAVFNLNAARQPGMKADSQLHVIVDTTAFTYEEMYVDGINACDNPVFDPYTGELRHAVDYNITPGFLNQVEREFTTKFNQFVVNTGKFHGHCGCLLRDILAGAACHPPPHCAPEVALAYEDLYDDFDRAHYGSGGVYRRMRGIKVVYTDAERALLREFECDSRACLAEAVKLTPDAPAAAVFRRPAPVILKPIAAEVERELLPLDQRPPGAIAERLEYDPKFQYLVLTKEEVPMLAGSFPGVMTVADAGGQRFDNVALLRTHLTRLDIEEYGVDGDDIYDKHKQSFVYTYVHDMYDDRYSLSNSFMTLPIVGGVS